MATAVGDFSFAVESLEMKKARENYFRRTEWFYEVIDNCVGFVQGTL